MSEKKWTSEDMSAAVERALQTMEGVALELYRRGREPLLEELETVKRERDEARAELATLANALDDIRHQRDRYHVELKQGRQEVERLREALEASGEP